METFTLRRGEDYIKLGQLLKSMNFVSSGVEAKEEILAGRVFVNEEKEERRGRKLYPGDRVKMGDKEVEIAAL